MSSPERERIEPLDFILIYAIVMIGIVMAGVIKWLRDRGKVLVRVLTPIGPKRFLKRVELDGRTIYMEKEKKKGSPWKFTFNQSYVTKGSLGLGKRQTVDVIYGAEKGVSYDYENKTSEAPTLDRAAVNKLFQAGVIKASGQTGQKLETPIFLYLLIGISIVISVLTLLSVSGRLRIG